MPHFDPLDGGTDAEIMFLFEKPGPMTSRAGGGSGFISRDNDDGTAEATFRFMELAGIPRRRVLLWNVVPGWNGTIRLTRAELEAGRGALQRLVAILPGLKAIVLVGRKAQRAEPLLAGLGVAIHTSFHPSPRVRASFPARWNAIPDDWARAGDGRRQG